MKVAPTGSCEKKFNPSYYYSLPYATMRPGRIRQTKGPICPNRDGDSFYESAIACLDANVVAQIEDFGMALRYLSKQVTILPHIIRASEIIFLVCSVDKESLGRIADVFDLDKICQYVEEMTPRRTGGINIPALVIACAAVSQPTATITVGNTLRRMAMQMFTSYMEYLELFKASDKFGWSLIDEEPGVSLCVTSKFTNCNNTIRCFNVPVPVTMTEKKRKRGVVFSIGTDICIDFKK